MPVNCLAALQLLFADRKIGAASKLAFLQLWLLASEQPGRIVITTDWLAGVCGRSPRSALEWLEELQSHDLLKIGERNPRRGTIVIDLYNPAPGDRVAIPDPQRSLPLAAGVSAQKPPRPVLHGKEINFPCQSTNVNKESKNPSDSMSVAGDIAALMAVGIFTTPAEQKERLKKRIISACRGNVSEWVAGQAANLVVYHGLPLEDVDHVLGDLDALRSAGTLRDAGAFVHAMFRKLAARHGKPWPRHAVS
jgi:hypothetical protein